MEKAAEIGPPGLERSMKVKGEMIYSSAGWSIGEGTELKGWPVMTILRGRTIMEWPEGAPRANITVDKSLGQYVARKPGHQLYPI